MTSANFSSYSQWQSSARNPASYFNPPPALQSSLPFSSSNSPLCGRTNPLPPSSTPIPLGGYSSPSFIANPLVGRTEPLNPSYPSLRFSTPPNFSAPSMQRNHEIRSPVSFPFQPSNSFALSPARLPQSSFQMPPLNPPTFFPLTGRVDVVPPPIGPGPMALPFRDFRLTCSTSDSFGSSWMPPPHFSGLPDKSPLSFEASPPFSSDRYRTTSFGRGTDTSLPCSRRFRTFSSTFSRSSEQVYTSLRRTFEETMREVYITGMPPERPISMKSWAPPVAFQVDSRTTLFIDPLTVNDFLQRATPEQRGAAQAQLVQLANQREQARTHSTAITTLDKTYSSLRTSEPVSIRAFVSGFAKGSRGSLSDSASGISNFVAHPFRTGRQIVKATRLCINLVCSGQWETVGKALSPEMHQLITQWDSLPSYKRRELTGYAIGKHGTDFFIPGALAKGAQKLGRISKGLKAAEQPLLLESAVKFKSNIKFEKIFRTHRTTFAIGKELGFSTREMIQLQQAGQLEGMIIRSFEHIVKNPAMHQSFELFEKAQSFLEPYSKQFMLEAQARVLIHKTGVRTFPRPNGIPENFKVKISQNGAGIHYVHSEHTHTSVRVMPGKPHSPFPYQQAPYVIHRKNGQTFDKFGGIVDSAAPEAHIPIEQFIFKD